MGRLSETDVAAKLAQALRAMPKDLIEEILRQGRKVPEDWRRQSIGEAVARLRRRFELTQRQLAILAGLPHSKVAKIEGGQDVRLSTLHQLFAGFGCGLVFLPVSRLSAQKLWLRPHWLYEEGYIPRRRRYPRK